MPLKKSRLNPGIQIQISAVAGKGIFAIKPLNKGGVIVTWGGEYVNKELADKALAEGRLVMQWDTDLYSIEDRGDDDGYFINHSCNPNCWMDGPYNLISMRDIDVGEELTADYALWEARPDYISKWKCKCGSAICRERVTGKDWMNKTLQNKYEGHFTPLINKLIEQSQT